MPKSLSFLLPFIFLLLGCRTDTPNPQNETVVIQTKADPQRLNPVLYPISDARYFNSLIFTPLADYDPMTLEYVPVMIEQIPTKLPFGEEGCSYTMRIKDGVKWDNGSQVTANDYLFTVKAILHPGTNANSYRSYLENITDIEIDQEDNQKFTVYFDDDYPLALQTATSFEILPAYIYDTKDQLKKHQLSDLRNPEWYAQFIDQDSSIAQFATDLNSNKYSREVVTGAGPYTLVNWITDEAIVLQRKENYWGNDENNIVAQGPKEITFRFIPDPVSAINELKSGQIDMITNVSADQFQALSSDSLKNQFNFESAYLMRYYFVILNTQNPVLSTSMSRQALAHITDVQRMIELLEGGAGKQTVSFVNPAKPYYNKSIEPYEFNIDIAKEKLSQDGWKDIDNDGIVEKTIGGKVVKFTIDYFASGDLGQKIGLLMKEEGIKAGIDINIIKKPYNLTQKENVATGNFGAVASALTQSLDLDDPYLRFHSDNAVLGGSNYAMYSSPTADSLIQTIQDNDDPKILERAFNQLQEVLYIDLPFLYLYVPQERVVSRSNVDFDMSIKRPGIFPNLIKVRQPSQ